MNKIIIALFIFLPIFACAENMCVKDGVTMVVLDPTISGTGSSVNAMGTWGVQFSYGKISGVASCAEANNCSTVNPVQTGGTYCCCKMLRPLESGWIYRSYGSGVCTAGSGTCAAACASFYSGNATANVTGRTTLFNNAKNF